MISEPNSASREKIDPRVLTNSPDIFPGAVPGIAPGAIIASSAGLVLRYARDDDADAIISLISAVWSEYPGKILVPETDMPELLHPATSYARCDGRFWVLEANGRIIGTVALQPSEEPGVIELQKLYVARGLRRNGAGSFLCHLVEREARQRGALAVELWSDVKLSDAHRRYEQLGYRRGPEIRQRDDTSRTVQHYYRKPFAGDATAARPAPDDDLPDWLDRLHILMVPPQEVPAA
jgi:N-acetylglutamate synthase-like GNAT family acetyltransferase